MKSKFHFALNFGPFQATIFIDENFTQDPPHPERRLHTQGLQVKQIQNGFIALYQQTRKTAIPSVTGYANVQRNKMKQYQNAQ